MIGKIMKEDQSYWKFTKIKQLNVKLKWYNYKSFAYIKVLIK